MSDEELVDRTAMLLLKIFGVQRGLFKTDQEYNKIIHAMAEQIKFHGQSMIAAADTIEAAYLHKKEDAEIQDALFDKEANVLTPIINYQVYLERDPKTTAALLGIVEKETFLAGLASLDEDRQITVLGWLDLAKEPKTTAAVLQIVEEDTLIAAMDCLSDNRQAEIREWLEDDTDE